MHAIRRIVAPIAAAVAICFPALAGQNKPSHPPQTGTMMKPVVCRVVEEGRGKSGQELASAVEHEAARFAASNYLLAALLPGDPPIACYRGAVDPRDLPKGAR